MLSFMTIRSFCVALASIRNFIRVPRHTSKTFVSSRALFPTRRAHTDSNHPPVPPPLETLTSVSDANAARAWIDRFRTYAVPRSAVKLSFSRSSGPGGQNVNKVNTKATIRCPIDACWIPLWAKSELRKSPYYISSSEALVITSTLTRSQAQNVDDCLHKLQAVILSSATTPVKNEPSEQQKSRVSALQKAEKASRLKQKSQRSAVKQGRAKGGWD